MKRVSVVIDDATSLLAVQKERRIYQDFPMIAELENQGREFGVTIWASTQEPHLVLSSAKNVNIRILMPLSSGVDLMEMAVSMGLNREETERAKSLCPGEAIIKVGTRPFGCLLIDIERSNMDRSITVEDARQKSEHIRNHLLSYVRPRSNKLQEILAAEAGKKKRRRDADQYLAIVAEAAGLMLSEMRKEYDLTIKMERSLRKQNLERRYIEVIEIPVPSRGNNPRVIKLTQRGKDRLDLLGKKPSHPCRGGAEHIFWQRRGKIYLEKLGYRAELERTIDGTVFDVYGINGDYKTAAIEIEMTSESLSNVRKGLGKTDRLIVACRSKKVLENFKAKAVHELGEEVCNRVEVMEVKDLYPARKDDESA